MASESGKSKMPLTIDLGNGQHVMVNADHEVFIKENVHLKKRISPWTTDFTPIPLSYRPNMTV